LYVVAGGNDVPATWRESCEPRPRFPLDILQGAGQCALDVDGTVKAEPVTKLGLDSCRVHVRCLRRYRNLVQDLQIGHPDQVWVSDISYIRLRRHFVYLAVIMDVFTRCIRGWHLGRSLNQSPTLTAVRRVLAYHRPEIHHSDQGVEYAATDCTHMLQEANVQISMADVGAAWQNGYAERLLRTVKEEEVDLSDYESYTDGMRQIGCFLNDVYTRKPIHSSLGYLTLAEFESHWQNAQRLIGLFTKNRSKSVQS